MDWVKVWWHCLLKTGANLRGEDHRMVEMSWPTKSGKHHFCTCGYLFTEWKER